MTRVQKTYKSLQVDRIIPAVGRLKKSIGSDDPKDLQKFNVMIDDLIQNGRLDDLKAIRSGTITLIVAFNQWKSGNLKGAKSLLLTQPYDPSVFDWLKTHDIAESTRLGYNNCFNQLGKLANKDTTIGDIPDLLRKYKKVCSKNDTAKSFNYTRTTCMAYISETLGRRVELYEEVVDIKPMKQKPKRKPNPLTVSEVESLISRIPEDIAMMVWSMCTTGMGPEEYLKRKWEVYPTHIHINGSKNQHRVRDIPIMRNPDPPMIQYKAFNKYINNASDGKVTPYDFRHTFATWMESAGVPRARRRLYMGHAKQDMTDLYETVEVAKFFTEDSRTLSRWFESQRSKTPIVHPKKGKVFQSDNI